MFFFLNIALLTGLCVCYFKFKHLLYVQFSLKWVSITISQSTLGIPLVIRPPHPPNCLSTYLYGSVTTVSEPNLYGNSKICLHGKRILEMYVNLAVI